MECLSSPSSDADVDFLGQELWWKAYTTQAALPTTKRVELVGKKEFAAAALDPEHKTYVVHVGSVSSVASPSSSPLDVHPFLRPQIAGLISEEALTKVSIECTDFANVFSPDLASKLLEHPGINDHAIKLVQVTRKRSKTSWERFDFSKRLFWWPIPEWRRSKKYRSSSLTVRTYGLRLRDLLDCRQLPRLHRRATQAH